MMLHTKSNRRSLLKLLLLIPIVAIALAVNAEALRVVNAMPKWAPSKQKGKVVPVRFTMPVNFSLDGSK